jgi:DNA-binding CsgD family transcriptional regulator
MRSHSSGRGNCGHPISTIDTVRWYICAPSKDEVGHVPGEAERRRFQTTVVVVSERCDTASESPWVAAVLNATRIMRLTDATGGTHEASRLLLDALPTFAHTSVERKALNGTPDALSALTCQETAVLRALLDGECAKQIARRTGRSVSTVRTHIRSILSKLSVHSQLQATAMARRALSAESNGHRAVDGDQHGPLVNFDDSEGLR